MKVNLLKHQVDFLLSEKKFTLLKGGIGSGKSFIGAHYLIKRANEYPGVKQFIGANTYSQLRDSTLATLFGVLEEMGITYTYNQNKGMIEFLGSTVLARSMDNYNTLRGIEIDNFYLDEVAYTGENAFKVIMGRLRGKIAPLEGRLTSSPCGFNWLFDYFSDNGEKNTGEFTSVNAPTLDNPYLPDGYHESLKGSYSDTLYKQEVLGEWVNITQGKVYYAFDRDINIKKIERRHGTIFVGMDFNVNPMTAVCCQFINNQIEVIEEVFLEDSNTIEMCTELIRKGFSGATVVPDSTGRNRKTSGLSDFEILRSHGFNIMSTFNPIVFDRVNCLNLQLSKGKVIINPSCTKLIADLEKVCWKGQKIDKQSDPMLSHVSDALGYAAFKLIGIQRVPRLKYQMIRR